MAVKHLSEVDDPRKIVTAIDSAARFPEMLVDLQAKYASDIAEFKKLVATARHSAELLYAIREGGQYKSGRRMSLLKIFRRCVSPVLDTEMTKKIRTVSTRSLIENFGETFKPIETLRKQFASMSVDQMAALAALIGEYDTRGQLGYVLTGKFFEWFEAEFKEEFTIEGPRGAGPDIQLSTVFPEYGGSYPCDFVIRERASGAVLAIGFARYDSTRGGAQSDDRTGGNSDKVSKALAFCQRSGKRFRIVFLADGPGLTHRDTWEEACGLDAACDGNVRVTTLKLASERITRDWLRSA